VTKLDKLCVCVCVCERERENIGGRVLTRGPSFNSEILVETEQLKIVL